MHNGRAYRQAFFTLCLLFFISGGIAHSAELIGIRHSVSSGHVRIVLDLSGPVVYTQASSETGVSLTLPETYSHAPIPDFSFPDAGLPKISVAAHGTASVIRIANPSHFPIKAFALTQPDRIILDIQRTGNRTVTLRSITQSSSPFQLRIVATLSDPVEYSLTSDHGSLVLTLPQVTTRLKKLPTVHDPLASEVLLQADKDALKIIIPREYATPVRTSTLTSPFRIVVDLKKIYHEESRTHLAEGVETALIQEGTRSGPLEIHVVTVDPAIVDLFPALAKAPSRTAPTSPPTFLERIFGGDGSEEKLSRRHFEVQPLSKIAADHRALAAINGGFFSAAGRPLGILMVEEQLIAAPILNRPALIATYGDTFTIDHPAVAMSLTLPDGSLLRLDGLNQAIRADEAVLYTTHFMRTDDDRQGLHIVVSGERVKELTDRDVDIPRDGYVVGVHGPMAEVLKTKIHVGDPLPTTFQMDPSYVRLKYILGGGPELVKQGKIHVTAGAEKFKADIANSRAARTALGLDKEGNILLVTVDGRPKKKISESGQEMDAAAPLIGSVGMTLQELAEWMKGQGAEDAMNLDGGSSTTMVIKGQVVNHPTLGGEKSISNALIVRTR